MNNSYQDDLYQIVENNNMIVHGRSFREIKEVKYPKHISSQLENSEMKLICGDDDRILFNARLTPNSQICRILVNDHLGNQFIGTGFFIAPKTIITSGHCVFLNNRWVSSIIIIPGDNGIEDRRPYGSQISTKFKSVKGWTVNNNRDFDYGAIILEDDRLYQNIKNVFVPKLFENEKELINFGYSDEPSKRFEQWGDYGETRSITSHRIFYMNDTVKGNSGSPIIVKKDNTYFVVGIHSYGNCPNFCVKINQTILKIWEEWKKI